MENPPMMDDLPNKKPPFFIGNFQLAMWGWVKTLSPW
jgi:hypothetical protein